MLQHRFRERWALNSWNSHFNQSFYCINIEIVASNSLVLKWQPIDFELFIRDRLHIAGGGRSTSASWKWWKLQKTKVGLSKSFIA